MMKKTKQQPCLDAPAMRRYLAEECDESEETRAGEHLNECADCRARLEEVAAEPDTWRAVREHLGSGEWTLPGSEPAGATPDGRDQLSELRSLLDPTDDPSKLGRIGAYEVCGLVGRGMTGMVVKALEPRLGRYVAIKLLSPNFTASGSARQRFEREGRAIAAVSHEHVVPIHAVDEHHGLPYIVMAYVPGLSLQQRIDRDGPLDTFEVARIGLQVARGLAAAHDQGIIHRDVKPANVLLEDTVERALVTDFGLARVSDEATMTRSGTLSGTPPFMSPEQARGESVGSRSDLFSLGSTLYAACTGRPPFRAETVYGIIRRVCEDEPRPLRELQPGIAEWLSAIIERLMSKRPEDRFGSALEVADVLRAELAHAQSPTVAAVPPRDWWPRATSGEGGGGRRRRVALGAGALCIALFGGWLAGDSERARETRTRMASLFVPGIASSEDGARGDGVSASATDGASDAADESESDASTAPAKSASTDSARAQSEERTADGALAKWTRSSIELPLYELGVDAGDGEGSVGAEAAESEPVGTALQPIFDQRLEQSIELEAGTACAFQIAGASLQLVPADGDRLRIVARRRVVADDEAAARARLGDHAWSISRTDGRLVLAAAFAGTSSHEEAHYRIEVPTQSGCAVDLDGGDLSVGALDSPLNAVVRNGDLRATEGLGAACDLLTIRGDIYLEGGRVENYVRTSSGDVHLGRNAGETTAQTSGGDIFVDGVEGPTAVHASGANVYARLFEHPAGGVVLSSGGGRISLELDDEVVVRVDASGALESLLDFEEETREDGSVWHVLDREAEGPGVRMASTSGVLRVSRADLGEAQRLALGGSGPRASGRPSGPSAASGASGPSASSASGGSGASDASSASGGASTFGGSSASRAASASDASSSPSGSGGASASSTAPPVPPTPPSTSGSSGGSKAASDAADADEPSDSADARERADSSDSSASGGPTGSDRSTSSERADSAEPADEAEVTTDSPAADDAATGHAAPSATTPDTPATPTADARATDAPPTPPTPGGSNSTVTARPGELTTVAFDAPRGNLDGYTLFLPDDHDPANGPYAVLLFMTGGYGVGGPIDAVNHWALPRILRDEAYGDAERDRLLRREFIVVNLHVIEGNYDEHPEVVDALLDDVIARHAGDPDRVYVTGLSRGGHGTWGLAAALPGRFAAVAPVGGGAGRIARENDWAPLAGLPVWIAHNRRDTVVSFEEAERAMSALEALSGEPFLQVTPNELAASDYLARDYVLSSAPFGGHDAWSDLYLSAEFYRWLLAHRRSPGNEPK